MAPLNQKPMDKENIKSMMDLIFEKVIPSTEQDNTPMLFSPEDVHADKKDEFTVLDFALTYPLDDTLCKQNDPVPKQSVKFFNQKDKNGDVFVYPDKHTGKRAAIIRTYLPNYFKKLCECHQAQIQQYLSKNHPGFKPFEKEVFVSRVEFVFRPLNSFSKKKMEEIRTNKKIHFKFTRPDLHDNLKKPIFDAMNGLIYMDDGQVCFEGVTLKRYGMNPGVIIRVIGR